MHLKEDREEYQSLLQNVSQWLTQADAQVHQKIDDIPQATSQHQVIFFSLLLLLFCVYIVVDQLIFSCVIKRLHQGC